MELLKDLSPASIDAEFRCMAPESGGSVEWVEQLMKFLLDRLSTNRDFELVQSYIGLFLKVCVVWNKYVHVQHKPVYYVQGLSKKGGGRAFLPFPSNPPLKKICFPV